MKRLEPFTIAAFAVLTLPAALVLVTGNPWWLALYAVFGLIVVAAG